MNPEASNNAETWVKDWDAFFNEFYSYLRGLAISHKLPSQDVDDVVQEIFIAMSKHFQEHKFDPSKGSIRAWITTFAKWRIIDIIRRNQRQNKVITTGDDLLMESRPDDNQDFDTQQENKYQVALFKKAVKNLAANPNKDFEIFCDSQFQHLTHDEIVAKYKVKDGAVYIAKHRTVKRIKEEIANILHEHPQF